MHYQFLTYSYDLTNCHLEKSFDLYLFLSHLKLSRFPLGVVCVYLNCEHEFCHLMVQSTKISVLFMLRLSSGFEISGSICFYLWWFYW